MKYEIEWVEIPDPFENRESIIRPSILGGKLGHSIFDSLQGDDDDDDDDEEDDDFLEGEIPIKGFKFTKGVITQAGVVPVNESWNPFKGYYGHANFYITRNVQNIVISVPGVEAFKPLSPYRFKISFGKYWEKSVEKVKKQIISELNAYLESVYNM